MKKLLMLLCAVMLVFGMVGGASALPITFTDTTTFTELGTNPTEDYDDHNWGDVNRLDGFLDYVAWTHHFSFDPPADEVLSGMLTLHLRDDRGWTGAEDFWFEFGGGIGEDLTWDFGEVDTGSYAYDITTSSLEDGSYSVIVGSLGGDFYIDQSDLEITYSPATATATAPVPEPATILLMGFGLLGLVGYSRKRFSKKA